MFVDLVEDLEIDVMLFFIELYESFNIGAVNLDKQLPLSIVGQISHMSLVVDVDDSEIGITRTIEKPQGSKISFGCEGYTALWVIMGWAWWICVWTVCNEKLFFLPRFKVDQLDSELA